MMSYSVVVALSRVTQQRGDFSHSPNSNDTFDSQVSLIRERPCKVIRANLISWNECVRDQELGPLVE